LIGPSFHLTLEVLVVEVALGFGDKAVISNPPFL